MYKNITSFPKGKIHSADSKKFHKKTNIKTFKVSNTTFLKDQVEMIQLWIVKYQKKLLLNSIVNVGIMKATEAVIMT